MFLIVTIVGLMLISYLLGSVCSAILVCRLMKLPDPRTLGSQNPGVTNVKRIGGMKAAGLTLFGDALKSFIPVYTVLYWDVSNIMVSVIFIMVLLGHIFPIFFDFKGGKGWASVLGGMFALDPLFGLAVLLTWLIVVGISRISALGALVSSVLAPLYTVWFVSAQPYWFCLVMISLLLFWTHRSNIKSWL
jgi:acyl phosphate:glycerol-3-phosphate acyltransferase